MNIFNKLKMGAVGLFCFFMTSPFFAAYSMSFQEKIKKGKTKG